MADSSTGRPEHIGTVDAPIQHDASKSFSKRARVAELTKTSIARVKEITPGLGSSAHDSKDEATLGALDQNAAFRTSALHNQIRTNKQQGRPETSKIVSSIGQGIIQPKAAIKKQARKVTAGKLSSIERSFISRDADLDLLEAHDQLRTVQSETSTEASEPDSILVDTSIESCRARVRQLEEQRESLRAAWITDHQVFRVRVIPTSPYPLPDLNQLGINSADESGAKKVLRLLGHGLLYLFQDFCTVYIDEPTQPRFDVDLLRNNIERLIVASAAWQSWLYDLRTVYRWDDPSRTGRWLAIFTVLWYTDHVVGFMYAYILYIVIKNRFAPTSVQSVRDSAERAADNKRKATRFVELIDKHGAENWIDAVIEELGPDLQSLTVDLSDYVEILVNFYEWKSPFSTFATLLFFATCFTVTCLADMAFCVKMVWFVAGGTFFFLWPIASHYPRYRAVVSPVRWTLWGIPTHAEWAFQYLRQHAQERREQIIKEQVDSALEGKALSLNKTLDVKDDLVHESNSEPSDSDSGESTPRRIDLVEEDIRFFRALEGTNVGRLILSTSGIRFVRKFTGAEDWRMSFLELSMMWKAESITQKIGSSRGRLVIQELSGNTHTLEGIRERDDAFNSIIAFSGLRWQNLQPR